jgi:hypothetical protein
VRALEYPRTLKLQNGDQAPLEWQGLIWKILQLPIISVGCLSENGTFLARTDELLTFAKMQRHFILTDGKRLPRHLAGRQDFAHCRNKILL